VSLLNPSIATNDLKHKTRKRTLVRVYCVTVIVVEYTTYVLVLDTLFYRWPHRYSKLTHSVFYHHQGHNINRWQPITTLCRQRIIPLCRQPITTLCRQPITTSISTTNYTSMSTTNYNCMSTTNYTSMSTTNYTSMSTNN